MENMSQIGMTNLMYYYASSGNLTIKEAKKMLHENAYTRLVAETLSHYCDVEITNPDLLRRTVTNLLLESNPTAKRDSIDRKVRMWLNQNREYISKESALQIAFSLQLPINEAEEFLWRSCGETFHWRNPEDISYLFALKNKMNYSDAFALCKKMEKAYLSAKGNQDDENTMTESIRQKVTQIKDENELEDFITENAPHLGKMHNTAFDIYNEFMHLLKDAPSPSENNLPEARKMSAREIVETYLYNQYIPRGQRNNNDDMMRDAISRNIQQNWPDEFTLARISNREIDVTRKVLILLFLACDGGETNYGYYADGYYAEGSPESIFQDSYARLTSMLNDCGFQPLDPRNPFDWMVLYCMTVNDILDIDEKIAKFLSEIFRDPVKDEAYE